LVPSNATAGEPALPSADESSILVRSRALPAVSTLVARMAPLSSSGGLSVQVSRWFVPSKAIAASVWAPASATIVRLAPTTPCVLTRAPTSSLSTANVDQTTRWSVPSKARVGPEPVSPEIGMPAPSSTRPAGLTRVPEMPSSVTQTTRRLVPSNATAAWFCRAAPVATGMAGTSSTAPALLTRAPKMSLLPSAPIPSQTTRKSVPSKATSGPNFSPSTVEMGMPVTSRTTPEGLTRAPKMSAVEWTPSIERQSVHTTR
jgi:hypothetical protein